MKRIIVLLMLIFALDAWAQMPCKQPCSVDGVSGGRLTSALTVEGTVKTEQYFIFDSVSEPTCPAGVNCMYNDGTNILFYNGSSWDDLTASGSGYWSLSGSNLTYSTGTIAVGSASANNAYNITIDETSDSILTGVFSRVKGTDASTNYTGVNGTASGSGALRNTGVYCWASGATTNICVRAALGDIRIDNGDLVIQSGEITNNSADGTHYWNFCNSIAYSGTDVEGNVYCNYTDNTITVYFDGTEYNLVVREYTATAPTGACTDGEPDVIETDTDLLWICINSAWVSK